MLDSILDSDTSSLPPWVDAAIALIEPLLQVMARPVVVNTLRRAAADPFRPTSQELHLFLERLDRSMGTFVSPEQANAAMPALRRLLQDDLR